MFWLKKIAKINKIAFKRIIKMSCDHLGKGLKLFIKHKSEKLFTKNKGKENKNKEPSKKTPYSKNNHTSTTKDDNTNNKF